MRASVALSGLVVLFVFFPAGAFAASFSDVSSDHAAYDAVEYLKAAGIVGGYPDGTFQPDRTVNRAEALKMILAPIVPEEGLAMFTKSVFTDVPEGAWFLPYVEAGRTTLGIVAGPPQKTEFLPENLVNLAEFLKLYLLSQRADVVGSYAELTSALSPDAAVEQWYFPYVRYALASSMILVDETGMLHPDRNLTRADIAQMIYFHAMYDEQRRTQALLSLAENDIVNVLAMIDADQLEQAEYAAARSNLAARGALTTSPDESLVKGAVKTAEGFQFILRAYRAGNEGRLDDAIRLAGEAWNTANKVREFSPTLETVAARMQELAKQLADSARALQAQGTPAP